MDLEQTTVTANGLAFGALTCGTEGPLALCLHGFPDTAWTFRHLMPKLAAAGFRAVAPWLRGYAPTDVPADGDYTLAALATDANALHAACGGDGEAVLVGHDWGAMTAYVAAAREPQRWRRVVTMAVPPPKTAAGAFTDYAQLKRSFYIFLFQTGLAPIVGMNDLAFLDGLWRDWSPSYDATEDLVHVKQALGQPDNLMAAIGYYRAMFATGGGAGDAVPPQPTLYLHGTDDGAFGAAGVAGAEDELSAESRVDVLDGAGHFLHLDRPADVNQRIVDWLTPR
jgi:pimeloyl-ACP methyl ester carboxylesterase